jgi:hypothetical protein
MGSFSNRSDRQIHDDDARRKSARRPIYVWGTIRTLGCPTEKLLILNLSRGGFMGEARREYRSGCFVEVTLPGMGVRRARISWSERGKFGAQFLPS